MTAPRHNKLQCRGPTVVVLFLVLYMVGAMVFQYFNPIPDPTLLPGTSSHPFPSLNDLITIILGSNITIFLLPRSDLSLHYFP